MYIVYSNNIHIFKENNIEINILFLKLKDKYPSYKDEKINSIINLYFSKKYYGCEYDCKTEQDIKKFFSLLSL